MATRRFLRTAVIKRLSIRPWAGGEARFAGRLTLPALVLLAFVVVTGCEPEAEERVAEPPRKRTPEERFESIVETLKYGLENQSLSAQSVAVDGAPGLGDPVAAARIRVEHELIRPTNEGDPFRAKVTFVSESKVTVVIAPPSAQDKADAKKDDGSALADVEIDGLDIDALKTPSQNTIAEKLGSSPIKELESQDKRVFELEFKEGRWVLLDQPDPDVEPYYDLVLRRAIRDQ